MYILINYLFRVNKSRLLFVLLASLCLTDSGMAFAFPFRDNPQSFAQYMNSLRWKSGDQVKFQNLYQCDSYVATDSQISRYYCSGGYVTRISPKGREVCDLSWVQWERADDGSTKWNYRRRNCVFR